LDAAIENLRGRQRTTLQNIGYLDLASRRGCSRHVDLDAIHSWAEEHSFDAVIWTDLDSNFERERKHQFTADAAMAYLDSLVVKHHATDAFRYIKNAPEEVDTASFNLKPRARLMVR
jgi:hypothetical protein